MDIRALVDLAIEDDPRAPCVWVPSAVWDDFCLAIRQRPNPAGAVIYRGRTVRDGGAYGEVRTRL